MGVFSTVQKVVLKEALERRMKLFHIVCNGTVEVIVTEYSGGQSCMFREGLDKTMVGKSISGNATSWSKCNLQSL